MGENNVVNFILDVTEPKYRAFVKNYSVDHQNYQIFKVGTGNKSQYVHFQWGKFDFRMTFTAAAKDAIRNNPKLAFLAPNGKKYLAEKFEVLHRNEWFEFVKPTAHGMQLDETLWQWNGQDYFVEFPKDIRSVAQGFCAEELGLTVLETIAA